MPAELHRPGLSIGAAPAVFLGAAAVLLQVAYPLTHDGVRDGMTIAIVLLFAAASATHAVWTRGVRRGGAIVLVAAAVGFLAELIGVRTGYPFGHYEYFSSLGPRLGGVPVLIAAAWTMLAWPATVVAQRLARSYSARVAVGGWALASWDLFLDPQMVRDGHWRWRDPSPHLPSVPTVPLGNYAGWFLVAVAISAVTQALLGTTHGDDRLPIALYLWTWIGSTVALLVFLDLAAAACWGAVGMGAVAVPLIVRLRR